MGLFSRFSSGGPPHPPAPPAFHNLSHLSSPYALGHAPPQVMAAAQQQLQQCMRELMGLKQGGVINPNYGVLGRWLECLSRLMEPITMVKGPMNGMRAWCMEVQILIRKLKERIFNRSMPLMPQERQAIFQYGQSWLSCRGGGTDTGRPECQIVIRSLLECAQM